MPILRNWEESYDEQFALTKNAVQQGDVGVLGALYVYDRLSEVDYKATLEAKAGALATSASQDVNDTMGQLMGGVHGMNHDAKAECEGIKTKMDQLAQSSDKASTESWDTLIDKSMDTLKEKTVANIEKLRVSSKALIRKLPQDMHEAAARVFTRGLSAVVGFFENALGWLQNAFVQVAKWVKKAFEKVQEWGRKVSEWFEAARSRIGRWFGGAGVDDIIEQVRGLLGQLKERGIGIKEILGGGRVEEVVKGQAGEYMMNGGGDGEEEESAAST